MMVLNEKKTKFFVILSGTNPLVIHDVKITYSHTYLYLRAWFSDDVNMNTIMSLHMKSSETQRNKFAIFCSTNTDMRKLHRYFIAQKYDLVKHQRS